VRETATATKTQMLLTLQNYTTKQHYKTLVSRIWLVRTTVPFSCCFYNNINKQKITLFKKKGIQLIKSSLIKKRYFDLKLLLKKLYKTGIRNILVEGGDELSGSFLKNKLFNEFYLFKSPKNLSKLVANKDFNCFKQ
jgi:riboflavin biosynthesis pyrimidine reductase